MWLAGDGASLRHLTVSGTPEVNLGVAVKSREPLVWVRDCRIEDVRIGDILRKRTANDNLLDNYGVRLSYAAYAVVRDSEIWAHSPIYLSGVRQCCFIGNDLIPLTLYRGVATPKGQFRAAWRSSRNVSSRETGWAALREPKQAMLRRFA